MTIQLSKEQEQELIDQITKQILKDLGLKSKSEIVQERQDDWEESTNESSSNLFLWRISQSESHGYDTYDSAVVAAYTFEQAQSILPGHGRWEHQGTWASSPSNVNVEFIGIAQCGVKPGEVIVASFNAG